MSSSEHSDLDDHSDNGSDFNESPQDLQIQANKAPLIEAKPETKDEQRGNIPPERQGKVGPVRIPINAFGLFKEENFETIKRDNPHLTHMELIDLIAQKWGESDKAFRDEYQTRYLERKQNFPKFTPVKVIPTSVNEPSILNWKLERSKLVTSNGNKAVTPQQEPPKKPTSAFFQFKTEQYAEAKAQHPHALETELTTIIAEKWRNLDEKQKRLYETQFAEAKEKYEKDLKEYPGQQSNKKRNWTEEKVTPKPDQDSEQNTPKKPSTIKKTLSRLGSFLSYFGLSDSK